MVKKDCYLYISKITFVLVSCCWLVIGHAQTTLTLGGTGTDLATMRQMANAFMAASPGIKVHVLPSIGSGGGVRGVVKGELDIGLTSRPLKQKESVPGIHAILYAKTPLIFAVSDSNTQSAITTKQLTELYTGKLLHWPDGSVARPVLRPVSDSDTLMVRAIYPNLGDAIIAAQSRRGVPVAATDQEAADMLEKVPGGFGTSTLAVIRSEKRPLKALVLNDVMPSPATLADGTYTLVKELYFVLKKPVSESVREFLQFAGGATGREILTNTGHLAVEYQLDD